MNDEVAVRDPLGEWFRRVGTQLSDEDYEAGIRAIAPSDAEVAELQSAWENEKKRAHEDDSMRNGWAEVEALREQLAEREAVIERVKSFRFDRYLPDPLRDELCNTLDASPSAVLAEHDAEKWDEGWDDFSAGIEKWDNPYLEGAGQ